MSTPRSGSRIPVWSLARGSLPQ